MVPFFTDRFLPTDTVGAFDESLIQVMNALRLGGVGERMLVWEAILEKDKGEDEGLVGRGSQLM